MVAIVEREQAEVGVAAPAASLSVAGLFADHGVSVESVRQDAADAHASLVLGTHTASEARIASVLEALDAHTDVERIDSVVRLID